MHKRLILRDTFTKHYYNHAIDARDAWSRDERDAFLFMSTEEVEKVLTRDDERFADVSVLEVLTVYSQRAVSSMGPTFG